MSNEEQDEPLILAILTAENGSIVLMDDGYWESDGPGGQDLAYYANTFACWEEWTPDKGDAAIWACETVVEHIPGELTAFFTPADMGNPLEDSAKTP
tara:strand:- start:392 stop:682 length:291 start_codon:yes stop_codon:yes gene_type:complete